MQAMDYRLEQIKQMVISGKYKHIESTVRDAIKEDVALEEIINAAMIAGMDVVGEKFSAGEIFVPEMLVAAATMKKGLYIIKPLLKKAETPPSGTIVMCTVKGDMHDIGKNLVNMMLEGAGFNVIDLGVDLSAEKLVGRLEAIKPAVLGLSALLTTTMPEMKKVVQTLKARGLRDKVKVIIGGAPVDAAFADKIGADGYGEDAAAAVRLARALVGNGSQSA
jgi:5-methyltetrahydrofolate--homocysteine methyltransferase